MEVVRKDLPAIWGQVSKEYQQNSASEVVNKSGSIISKGSFEFYQAPAPRETLNTGSHSSFELRSFFHILDAIMKMLDSMLLGNGERIKIDPWVRNWKELGDIPARMKKADWSYDYSDDARVWEKGNQEVKQLLSDMNKHKEPEKKALMESLWRTHVPQYTVRKPDSLSNNPIVMSGEDYEFNQRQFKATGMLDHFTADVVKMMSEGQPQIRKDVEPVIDGEKVKGAIHLNKAKDADRYFLNKFEMEKTKADGTTVKQTFYNNNRPKAGEENGNRRPPQQWTQKRAFNFLSGRPVYDKNNDEWNRINFKEKLKNDNHATQRFDKSYGFDLRKTMAGYSYADTGDQRKMSQMVESFERGNLVKAKLVDNQGRKEDYHMSLSIRTSSMRIYDKDMKEVPLEDQVQKGIITKELSDKLKEIYANKQKQGGQKVDATAMSQGLPQTEVEKKNVKQTAGKESKDGLEVDKKRHGQRHK